jgi:cell division protein FtsZ
MGLVMNFTGSSELSYTEVVEAADYLQGLVNPDAENFWGLVFDDQMGDEVEVTVVATGIDAELQPSKSTPKDHGKGPRVRDARPEELQTEWEVRKQGQVIYEPPMDVPHIHREMNGNQAKEGRHQKKSWKELLGFKRDLDYPTFLRMKELPQKG